MATQLLIPTVRTLQEAVGSDLWTRFVGSRQPLTAATIANRSINLMRIQLLVGTGEAATMEVTDGHLKMAGRELADQIEQRTACSTNDNR